METGCYRDGHGDRYPWWRLYESSRPCPPGRAGHNSLSVTRALGMDVDSMHVEVIIGVPQPEAVDTAQVLAILPHGTGEVKVVHGGLEILSDNGVDKTIIANAAAVVRLDLP